MTVFFKVFDPILSIYMYTLSYSFLFLNTNRIARTEISCTSAAFDDSESSFVNASRVGSVLVFIDNANARLSGMEFEFRDDPIYTHVHPRTVIPA